MILYLHGFRSGPQSVKSTAMQAAMAARGLADYFYGPQLPFDPAQAMALCAERITAWQKDGQRVTVVGSSLGGYYATWLAEQHNLNAVLINPSVLAHISLADYIGPITHFYSDEVFEFTQQHVDTLRQMEVAHPDPRRYLLLAEKGDEVLDWRQAAKRYAGCRQIILEGGDHSFSRFTDYLPTILAFAGLGESPNEPAIPARI